MTTLYVQDSGVYREAAAEDILSRAQRLMAQRFRRGSPVLKRIEDVQAFLALQLAAKPHEVFAVLFVDSRLRLIEYVELFRGTLGQTSVYPREIAKEALARNAAGVILVHNHPSAAAEPSQADEIITRCVKDALELIGVRVIDHLIVGDGIYSFAHHGRL